MPHSPLQSIRRYQSISMFGGGILVTVLILITSGLGMASIVYGHLEAERHHFLNGKEETLEEIKVSETSFRTGVSNTQLIWRETGRAPDSVVDSFFDNDQRIAIKPYPSLVVGVPGQTGNRAEVARYLALSVLLSRIAAASSINRGKLLEGYHYSTRAGVFGLVPALDVNWPALATPERRAGVLDALRIDFGDEPPPGAGERPRVRWLAPYDGPITGQARVRIAAQAYSDGEPFAVLVTEYAPEFLLSWLPEERLSKGTFFITTTDGQLVTMDPRAAADRELSGCLLGLNVSDDLAKQDALVFRNGFVVFRSRLESTGWTLAYALSWAEIAAGVAWQAGTLAAATLLALVVMWTLLVRFYRRTLVPVYARSQRVFDSETLCRHVIGMAPIGIGLVSLADKRMMLASAALTEMISACGGDYQALSARVIDKYEAFLASGAGEGSMQVDLLLDEGDAAPLHLEAIVRGARYQGEDVLIAAIVDVTAERELVRKLEEAVRAADSANAAKSSFLAAMSHEIRTPLNVILGNLELLDRSALDAAQHDRVRTLRASATSLLALVSDVLDFSKIEAGAMTVESIEFDLIDLIERELAAYASIAKAKGLPLFAVIDAGSAQRMRGDPTRLAQVFGNLLSNAIKFTSEGRVTARVAVRRNTHGAAELEIAVDDTGIGIAVSNQRKLFKAFSQVDASITRRYGGTGLGLALCDRLVAAMGGTISVASTLGVGSCFTVRAPLGADIVVDAPCAAADGCTVLLASTEDAWRDLALPRLRAWGFDVDTYDSPAHIPPERMAHAGAVLLFGDVDAWRRAELDSLGGGDAPIILATPDGPLLPDMAGRTIRVSSYSPGGLRAVMTRVAAFAARRVVQDLQERMDAPASGQVLRVLLADGDAASAALLREQLDVLGCSVQVAGFGKTTLDWLADGAWDVLLLSGDLPDMSACALAERVRDLEGHCEVVVVTSHLAPADAMRYAAAGVERILTKPVALAHLRRALTRAAWRRGKRVPGGRRNDQAMST